METINLKKGDKVVCYSESFAGAKLTPYNSVVVEREKVGEDNNWYHIKKIGRDGDGILCHISNMHKLGDKKPHTLMHKRTKKGMMQNLETVN